MIMSHHKFVHDKTDSLFVFRKHSTATNPSVVNGLRTDYIINKIMVYDQI